jgi:hypothetical protein
MSVEDVLAKKAAESQPEAPAAPTVREAVDALQRHEMKTVPGAPSRMPKERMMDAPEAKANPANEGKHLRFVNPQNIDARKLDGYEIVPLAEGGKELSGHAVLMRQPQHMADAKIASNKQRNKDQLVAHKKEAENIAENLSRELRDKHGINITPERLLQD